jgi:multimeric flavodoxin WrbA
MKVLALNGSLRGAKGVTGRILQSIGEGVGQAGGAWGVVNLSDLTIEGCRACNHCQRAKTYRCILDDKDDVAGVFARMEDADLLIYASPVYVFGVSSLLKRFIERIHSRAPVDEVLLTKSGLFFHATQRSLSGKPFVSIVVCDNVENLTVRNTREYLRIFGRFMDAPRVAHVERRSAAAWLAALEGTDKRARKRAESVLSAYVRAGEELVSKGCISPSTRKKAELPFIKIPLPVRVARHVPALRPFIAGQVRKRSRLISNRLHL